MILINFFAQIDWQQQCIKVDLMKTEHKPHKEMTEHISNVISKATQVHVSLFHHGVNTFFIKVLWVRSESVLNIVHDFFVRIKTATLQCLCQRVQVVMMRWQPIDEMTVWRHDDKLTLSGRVWLFADSCHSRKSLFSLAYEWMKVYVFHALFSFAYVLRKL